MNSNPTCWREVKMNPSKKKEVALKRDSVEIYHWDITQTTVLPWDCRQPALLQWHHKSLFPQWDSNETDDYWDRTLNELRLKSLSDISESPARFHQTGETFSMSHLTDTNGIHVNNGERSSSFVSSCQSSHCCQLRCMSPLHVFPCVVMYYSFHLSIILC